MLLVNAVTCKILVTYINNFQHSTSSTDLKHFFVLGKKRVVQSLSDLIFEYVNLENTNEINQIISEKTEIHC